MRTGTTTTSECARPAASRPRTKTRPTHTDAVSGFVTTVDRGRYTCLVEEGTRRAHVVHAMRARELGRRAVAVGDMVDLVGDTDGAPDTLARIVRIAPRRSVLRRSADDTDTAERVLVANADQLVIVCALADPVPRTGFIDRCLVAAYTGNLDAVLVLTKADLADPAPLERIYADLDLPILVTRRTGSADGRRAVAGIDAVRERLDRSISVMIGHSGVGKSTLVNALVPDAQRATGSVTGVGKGRHTSTSAIALPLRGRRLGHRHPGGAVLRARPCHAGRCTQTFDDLLPATVNCPRTAITPVRRAVPTPPEWAARWMHLLPPAIRAPAGWPPSAACWRPWQAATTPRTAQPGTPRPTPLQSRATARSTPICDQGHTVCHHLTDR